MELIRYNMDGFSCGLQELSPRRQIYNSFFYPNVCHICKLQDSNNLIVCDRCRLISYCSEIHLWQHLQQHKDLCKAVVKLQVHNSELESGSTHLINFQQSTKFSIMNSVRSELSRDLERYEEQMFLFAKSCLICNRADELRTCKNCFVSNYCDVHEIEFKRIHHNCKILKLCFDLDTYILDKQWFSHFKIPKLEFFPKKNVPVVNMDDFIIQINKHGRFMENYSLEELLYTDWISGPLTLHYGLKEIFLIPRLLNVTYTIHIINIDNIDEVNFETWELLLHLVPNIKILTIVIITPKITPRNIICDICSQCSQHKKFFLECHSMLYQDYLTSAIYKKPNVVIGYHVNLNYFRNWRDILNAVQAQKCPLFLTTKSYSKAEIIANSTKRILHLFLIPDRIFENRFSSLRPHRDILHGIFYRNKYIISFETLNYPIELSNPAFNHVNCRL